MSSPRTRRATVLTAIGRGDTTPEITIYVVGPASARSLFSLVLSGALAGELGTGEVREATVRIEEHGAREGETVHRVAECRILDEATPGRAAEVERIADQAALTLFSREARLPRRRRS